VTEISPRYQACSGSDGARLMTLRIPNSAITDSSSSGSSCADRYTNPGATTCTFSEKRNPTQTPRTAAGTAKIASKATTTPRQRCDSLRADCLHSSFRIAVRALLIAALDRLLKTYALQHHVASPSFNKSKSARPTHGRSSSVVCLTLEVALHPIAEGRPAFVCAGCGLWSPGRHLPPSWRPLFGGAT
jgi:hypothetical protein